MPSEAQSVPFLGINIDSNGTKEEAQVAILYFFVWKLLVISGEFRKIMIQFKENY